MNFPRVHSGSTLPDVLAARFDTEGSAWQHILRFARELVDGRMGTTDVVTIAAILLGLTCGVLGCFLVLRRQSLLGDAVGHAVLPGVFLGFLAAGTRSTPALLAGATVAGLLSAGLIALLQRTTPLKSGECIGVVFTGFYGIGILLLKYIQNRAADFPDQAGLDRFLFGQIVGVSETDLLYMGGLAVITLGSVTLCWRALQVWAFDEGFARSIGLPVHAIEVLITTLVTIAIVISIQAVGVVLVAAMLVTPAATAYLLTDRLHRMALLSGLFAALAGVTGAFTSLLREGLPTGSLMVLAAGLNFGLVFLVAPHHGVLPRVVRLWNRQERTRAENFLRRLYRVMEHRQPGLPVGNDADARFGLADLKSDSESLLALRQALRSARRFGWIDGGSADPIILTTAGLTEARRVVRNHRLWELFLTQEAKLASDHVHRDAERIEHVLPPDVIARLEQMLEYPSTDPHGRPIPT